MATVGRNSASLLVFVALGLVVAAPVRADELPPPPELLGDPAEVSPAEPAPAPPAPPAVEAPAVEAPPAPAPTKTAKKKALPAADAKPSEEGVFSTLGWGTVGGGAVAAVAVGGLTMLSPCGCAAPVACGAATCALGGGALIGHTIDERPWSARSLLPAGAAAGIGVAAGTAATLTVVVTPSIMDALLPDSGANPDTARNNLLVSSGVTALAAAVTLATGGLVAGWAATAIERAVGDEAPAAD